MQINHIKLAFFSPTGTTKTVLRAMAEGFGQTPVQQIDITLEDARQKPLAAQEDELLIVGVPVYKGRVPALLGPWFQAIKAENTPVVCVVLYGNRAYENALLELKDLMTQSGCKPVACAAYIGEHSFSSPELPTAPGRPDEKDLRHARQLGAKIREKLLSIESAGQIEDIAVPGEHPYDGVAELWDVDFIAVSQECTQCGICAQNCPTGAIDHEDSSVIDIVKCITCCACIKICPQKARSIKPGPVMEAALRLNRLFQEPKQPEFFI